jgi:predicted alpha/beta-hydrolase family hydrolase
VPDIILGYSAGARFGAAIAEDLGVKAVICLGYPFHHPAHGDEPDRYAHLATLRTPCLILQGRCDPYGGAEDLARFQFSPAVAVQFVDADHELSLDNMHQRMAIDAVLEFLRANGINDPSVPDERETQNLPASSAH